MTNSSRNLTLSLLTENLEHSVEKVQYALSFIGVLIIVEPVQVRLKLCGIIDIVQ